jgi:hypothetical protein
MYSGVVLTALFIFALVGVSLLLLGANVHDKAIDKTEKFTKEKFGKKGENE